MGLLGLLSLLHSAFFGDQVGCWGPSCEGGGVQPWEQLRGADRGDSGLGGWELTGTRPQA